MASSKTPGRLDLSAQGRRSIRRECYRHVRAARSKTGAENRRIANNLTAAVVSTCNPHGSHRQIQQPIDRYGGGYLRNFRSAVRDFNLRLLVCYRLEVESQRQRIITLVCLHGRVAPVELHLPQLASQECQVPNMQ